MGMTGIRLNCVPLVAKILEVLGVGDGLAQCCMQWFL